MVTTKTRVAPFSQTKIIAIESKVFRNRYHFGAVGQGKFGMPAVSVNTWPTAYDACNAGMREFPGSYTLRASGGRRYLSK